MAKAKHQLPEVDRRAMSMTKEQRLVARIKEHQRDIAYYKKWWMPSLVLGLSGIVVFVGLFAIGVYLPDMLFFASVLSILNGFYWLYKSLFEIRQMEKLQVIADKQGIDWC